MIVDKPVAYLRFSLGYNFYNKNFANEKLKQD